jgi:predicted Ser/Thr protein kinase
MIEHDTSTAADHGGGGSLAWSASDDDPAYAVLLQATQHAVQQRVLGVEPGVADERVFLGRYRVRSLAGKGGMGTVLAAEDEWLERKVALKIVNAPGARQRRRLVREGVALAKLSHPNVVQVHDVELGQRGEQAYVVMEYVEGTTLARWQVDRPRTVAELLDAYLQAARGLWAAHQVGIVHRDFKPHNALVDAAGVVKVADFGLASAAAPEGDDGDDDEPSARAHAITRPQVAAPLATETGLGLTPGYCAPEQLRGERPTAKADAFALCVALYQALTGVLPFGASRVPQTYAQAVAAGIGGRPEAARVPRRVARVLARGLALRPEDRFADMAELIAALQPRPLRWPWVAAVALALLAGVLAAMLRPPSQVEVAVDPCVIEDGALPLARVPARRGDGPWAFALERAAAFREAFRGASEDLCRAGRRGELEGAAQRQAQACLDTAAREHDLVLGLVAAEGSTTDPFLAFGNLRSPALCVLGGGRPAYGAADAELRHALDEVRALQLAGRNDEALPQGRALHGRARRAGDVVILANVAFLVGKLEGLVGEGELAARDLEEAAVHAEALGDDVLAIDALAELIDVAANLAVDPADGARWERLGEAKLRRAGVHRSEVAGQYHSAVGNLALRRRDFAAARRHARLAQELLAETTGGSSLATLIARTNHAVALVGEQRPQEAIAEYEQILALRRERYGERHLSTLYDELRLARARMAAKQDAAALEGLARVEAQAPEATPEGRRLRAFAAVRQCELLVDREDYARARPICERAFGMRPQLEGSDRRLLEERIILYGKQGLVLASLGDDAGALELLEHERELLLSLRPHDPAMLAYNTTTRCVVLVTMGRTRDCEGALAEGRGWYESSGREQELRQLSAVIGMAPTPRSD